MKRLARAGVVALLLLATPALVTASRAASPLPPLPLPPIPLLPTATGNDAVQTGMWFLLSPGGVVPAPPTVPSNGLWVASLPVGPIAMSAVRFQMKPGEGQPILTLNFANLTKLPATPLGTGPYPIVACPITSKWTPTGANPGPWSAHPTYDCSKGLVTGTVSTDQKRLIFDFTTITTPGQLVDLALIPGTVGNALVGILPIAVPSLPPLPSLPDGLQIPNPLASQGPSTFDASFAVVTRNALNTVTNVFGTSTSPPSVSAPPASTSSPSSQPTAAPTDVGPLASGPILASPAPALDQPVTATPAQTPVSPQQQVTTPITNATPAGAVQPVSNTTGRRILAGLLLLALIYWAFEMLVRRERAPATAADATDALTIGSWMHGSTTARKGEPPSIS
jgi:hypothetical protein